jgi:hypothetical protein
MVSALPVITEIKNRSGSKYFVLSAPKSKNNSGFARPRPNIRPASAIGAYVGQMGVKHKHTRAQLWKGGENKKYPFSGGPVFTGLDGNIIRLDCQ